MTKRERKKLSKKLRPCTVRQGISKSVAFHCYFLFLRLKPCRCILARSRYPVTARSRSRAYRTYIVVSRAGIETHVHRRHVTRAGTYTMGLPKLIKLYVNTTLSSEPIYPCYKRTFHVFINILRQAVVVGRRVFGRLVLYTEDYRYTGVKAAAPSRALRRFSS